MIKQPAVYIMANRRNGTLYTGVTSDLLKRNYEHKDGKSDSFTEKYGCKMLVFYREYSTALQTPSRKRKESRAEAGKGNWL